MSVNVELIETLYWIYADKHKRGDGSASVIHQVEKCYLHDLAG